MYPSLVKFVSFSDTLGTLEIVDSETKVILKWILQPDT